jgi:hypothetical protein
MPQANQGVSPIRRRKLTLFQSTVAQSDLRMPPLVSGLQHNAGNEMGGRAGEGMASAVRRRVQLIEFEPSTLRRPLFSRPGSCSAAKPDEVRCMLMVKSGCHGSALVCLMVGGTVRSQRILTTQYWPPSHLLSFQHPAMCRHKK